MDFGLSDDQRDIQRTARELLGSRATPERVREHAEAGRPDDALWKELVELGWPGIAVAEEHGGQGLGAVELTILCEELGYALAASPFLATVMAAAAIQESGTDEQKSRWLPALASGEATGALGEAGGLVADAEAASLAKAAASNGARDVTASAIQAHGGIGFTWEADVHWLYKRAQVDAALLGGAGRHRAALARIAAA